MANKLPFPSTLKPIQPYITLHKQFFTRDPVVAYYAMMYAVQEGIVLSKSDNEAKAYVLNAMNQLEQMKKALKDEEALQSDVVGSAYVEETALKLFDYSDKEDRASRFHKSMIKSFLTSAHLMTTLKQFGELDEEVDSKIKYAKWKAVEIDRCLKSGITPTPGPPNPTPDPLGLPRGSGSSDQSSEEGAVGGFGHAFPSGPTDASTSTPGLGDRPVPKPRHHTQPPPAGFSITPDPTPSHPPPTDATPFSVGPRETVGYSEPVPNMVAGGGGGGGAYKAGPDEVAKAQKLCKFAGSALDYDDVAGAIEFMSKAISLLKTGKE